MLQRKLEKGLLYDTNNMKFSIYEDAKQQDVSTDVRRTKKKFNLSTTSSTLEIFSQKLSTTVGRRPLRLQRSEKNENEENTQTPKKVHVVEKRKAPPLPKAEQGIANELDGLFA